MCYEIGVSACFGETPCPLVRIEASPQVNRYIIIEYLHVEALVFISSLTSREAGFVIAQLKVEI